MAPRPINLGQKPVTTRPGERGPSVPRQIPTQVGAAGSCFNCGLKGHYANSCPLPKKPQGFAAHVVNEDDSEDKLLDEDHPGPQDGNAAEETPEDIGNNDLDFGQDDDNPDGDQYDPSDGPGQRYWSELGVDDAPLYEDQELEGYAARVVPLSELLEVETLQANAATTSSSKENTLLCSQARRKVARVPPQPRRDPRLQRTINILLDIGGVRADVLIDCGSTTDMMTPQFARIAQTESVELEVQMGLRLAVKGSQSKLNYGTWADVTFGHIKTSNYFDLVNLDRHDVVLGTPFLWTHRIHIGFEGTGVLLQDGKRINVSNLVAEEDTPQRNARKNLQFFRAEKNT
jgi:hypothetical protein